jgi:hypothetical protein
MIAAQGGEMNDGRDVSAGPDDPGDAREPYEPPVLTTVGNARELLGGASGPVADACPFAPPGEQTQPS